LRIADLGLRIYWYAFVLVPLLILVLLLTLGRALAWDEEDFDNARAWDNYIFQQKQNELEFEQNQLERQLYDQQQQIEAIEKQEQQERAREFFSRQLHGSAPSPGLYVPGIRRREP